MKKSRITIKNIIPGTQLLIAWVPNNKDHKPEDLMILFNRNMEEDTFHFDPDFIKMWKNRGKGYYLIRARKYGLLPSQIYINNTFFEEKDECKIVLINKEDAMCYLESEI